MCRTTLTFLIAFPFQVNPSLDATKGKKKKKEKKEKKVKHHDKEEPPLDPHFLACDPKMKYSCTIQYKLMANMDTSVSVTVICWGRVSKVRGDKITIYFFSTIHTGAPAAMNSRSTVFTFFYS